MASSASRLLVPGQLLATVAAIVAPGQMASELASQLANQLLASLVPDQQLATPDQPGPELGLSIRSPAP